MDQLPGQKKALEVCLKVSADNNEESLFRGAEEAELHAVHLYAVKPSCVKDIKI